MSSENINPTTKRPQAVRGGAGTSRSRNAMAFCEGFVKGYGSVGSLFIKPASPQNAILEHHVIVVSTGPKKLTPESTEELAKEGIAKIAYAKSKSASGTDQIHVFVNRSKMEMLAKYIGPMAAEVRISGKSMKHDSFPGKFLALPPAKRLALLTSKSHGK